MPRVASVALKYEITRAKAPKTVQEGEATVRCCCCCCGGGGGGGGGREVGVQWVEKCRKSGAAPLTTHLDIGMQPTIGSRGKDSCEKVTPFKKD